MLQLQHDSSTPLVAQIIAGVRALVAEHTLKPGTKLPSIRAFAAAHAVSVFTVVEAYDRLVAQGVLTSRANAGFFVSRALDAAGQAPEGGEPQRQKPVFDAAWYLRQIFENRDWPIQPGCGWLPDDWMFADGVRRGLRKLASEGLALSGYGDPKGLPALRTVIAQNLAQDQLIRASAEQVLLTHGSSHALDLAARTLVQPGDVVLVDDPGYPNVMSMLRHQGAQLIGVPRTPEGYDMAELERLLAIVRPKAFFTQPRLQSPTCTRASLPQLHQLLQWAGQYDFMLVENDIYADMDASHQPSLASLDQLHRVIYIGTYSKTVSANLRVGYLLAHPQALERLVKLKMLSGLTSSEVSEQLVYNVVTDGRWRKHLKALRERLAQAHDDVGQRLQQLGFELYCEPREGMYLWARHPAIADGMVAVDTAARQGILLGLGQLFWVDAQPTGWLRFNVAFSQNPLLWQWLPRWLQTQQAGQVHEEGEAGDMDENGGESGGENGGEGA
ncbi:PLP-dependent aminotransferase family protein [Corticibacter populi]|uniref:PLP-dependent aminotransferase family protein n=1 Tax=Corticibacter populi TaxID=1550736 RepID=A0A3M6QTK0_9BURK|nr:PLP-dependent aminotransferase family protein [Corticibacter populi]RMX06356.1 PLP-dependent aminotransferase family protein [Corticibacter populi]RZS32102.1 GntR family transcriptional regulator [Corticibacter populi]